ncbi:MAG: hypothetical protein JRN09_03765 [Nitrososphaerota archaeon]|nr:hypothetical protein [Nitrososphaerota archaeon]
MNRSYRALFVGVVFLISSLAVASLGSYLQSLSLVVVSLILGVAGAFVALRGVLEFIAERV